MPHFVEMILVPDGHGSLEQRVVAELQQLDCQVEVDHRAPAIAVRQPHTGAVVLLDPATMSAERGSPSISDSSPK